MADLPSIRRFQPGDYKSLPDAFTGRFLSALNLFTDPVYVALQNGLNFFQNFNAQTYPFQLTAGTTADLNVVQFKQTIKGKPSALELCSVNVAADPTIPILNAVGFSWYSNSGTVFITAIAGLTAGTVYNLTVRLT